MKPKTVIHHIVRGLSLAVFALLVLLCGTVTLLYSPWAQELLRQNAVRAFSSPDFTLQLDSLALDFPLDLSLRGLRIDQDGQSLVRAGSLRADIRLMPLLAGKAKAQSIDGTDIYYRLGTPDSAMYMTIAADSVGLQEASVRLRGMKIKLPQGTIAGADIAMVMNPDTTVTPPTPPMDMSVEIGQIGLRDLRYSMRMLPAIDTLTTTVAQGMLHNGNIDMLAQTLELGTFAGQGLDARYIVPDSTTLAALPPIYFATTPTDTTAAPWTVKIDTIHFDRSQALYTTAGTTPLPGLDFAYIQADSMTLDVRHFYNRAADVRVPLSLSARERCGLTLYTAGTLGVSATMLDIDTFAISTPNGTALALDAAMGMGDLATDPSLPLSLETHGGIAPEDLALMFPVATSYLKTLRHDNTVNVDADISGTAGLLEINDLSLAINSMVWMTLNGKLGNAMQPDKMTADINLNGGIENLNPLKPIFLDAATAKEINIPPTTLAGHLAMDAAGTASATLTGKTRGGALSLKGSFNSRAEKYTAALTTSSFPIQAFMPLAGISDLTASLEAKGQGLDMASPRTALNAKASIQSVTYQDVKYSGITATANIADGTADIALTSANPDLDLDLNAQGNLTGKQYNWTASLDGRNIDLQAMKMSQTPMAIEITLNADAQIGPGNDMAVRANIPDLFLRQQNGTAAMRDIAMTFNTDTAVTAATVTNRDLRLTFNSPVTLDTLTARFAHATDIALAQITAFTLNTDSIQRALPPFDLSLTAGASNLINDYLAPDKTSIRHTSFSLSNDSLLRMDGKLLQISTPTATIDTVTIDARQYTRHMIFRAAMGNQAGNMDEWHHVGVRGIFARNQVGVELSQQNLKGATGFHLGILGTAAADSTITVNFKPYDPTIGYQPWTVNPDNFISYNIPTQHIDANLHLSGANSSLAIFTQHPGGEEAEDLHVQEPLTIQLKDIRIQDWIAFNPWAPPMRGIAGADITLRRLQGRLVGDGSVSLADFLYGKQRVGDFRANFDVSAAADGSLHADADLYVDGKQTMTVSGALNDSTLTSPMNLDFRVIHFPLATVNPFMPVGTAKLRGTLNGNMEISGTSEHPTFNGTLDFDSTAVRLAMTGQEYTFSTDTIPIRDNIVRLNRFEIFGSNDNPLRLTGTVDLRNMENVGLDLALKADNMQIVNTKRAPKGADIYGRGFINLDASARGNMRLLFVDAALRVLPGTNITYVLPDAQSIIASQSTEGLVKFVNLSDSAAVVAADSIPTVAMAMILNATVDIDEATTVNVDLNSNGSDRVQIDPSGHLEFSMTPASDGRLTGRLNINSGFARYSLPVMGEKRFAFDAGSYVAFTGNMLNPTLNIHATDVLKANVTQEGQNSRLVNFNVMLGVTGTLERMNVAFDLSTNDDITVANELQSMSPEQRANQAMNLLLYNMYTGPGTRGNAALGGNALYSFVESSLNSWAANNIKGVDLSFGIDQYDKTVDGNSSTATSYSYQVSKSLFNDRFKISVGGNYSTDANADENFSQNLINDISFEYFLNATHTMYLRLFRHTGYESILEGEITQTGVGFVYRRKIERLADMFRPFRRKKDQKQ